MRSSAETPSSAPPVESAAEEFFFEPKPEELEDLSDLPPPPRRRRHPIMMLVVMIFSALLMWLYWEDVAYFLQPAAPQDLGETAAFEAKFRADANFDPDFPDNGYVRLAGLTGLRTHANDGQWTFFKLAYVPVYVQLGPEQTAQLEPDQALYLSVSGRLRRLAFTSRYDRLQDYYRQRFGVSFENAYILEAGKKPRQFWWAPALFGLFAAFILGNGVLLVRRLAAR